MTKQFAQIALATLALAAVTAHATPIMPSLANAPAGWSTDRYAPASFSDVGTFQGRADVLGIGIDQTGNLANRAAPYRSSFYDTQGKGTAAVGGAGSVLAADLYIPGSWANALNGSVRTDMWGVATDASGNPSAYAIIGFTNFGGAARLRVYDGDVSGGWVDVAAPVNYNDWNDLAINFTGNSLVYSINGSNVYTDSTIDGTTGFSSVLMQAYNFADPAISGANNVAYVAHWANAQDASIPEPATIALFGLGLAGVAAVRRKTRKSTR